MLCAPLLVHVEKPPGSAAREEEREGEERTGAISPGTAASSNPRALVQRKRSPLARRSEVTCRSLMQERMNRISGAVSFVFTRM